MTDYVPISATGFFQGVFGVLALMGIDGRGLLMENALMGIDGQGGRYFAM